jgi:hypothetical protein
MRSKVKVPTATTKATVAVTTTTTKTKKTKRVKLMNFDLDSFWVERADRDLPIS